MKALLYYCAVFGLLLAGCGQKSSEEKPKQTTNTSAQSAKATSVGNPVTAPVDYLGAVGKAKIASEKTIDTIGLDQAIQMFNVQEGRYPKNLNELVEKEFIRALPEPPYGMQIVYDPSNGKVKIVRK